MCSIQRSLCSAAVSPMPTTRYLALCKPASMKLNGVPAVRECGWSKRHWGEMPGRRALLTGRSWQPKDAYETFKHQHPTSREDPSTRSRPLKHPRTDIQHPKKIQATGSNRLSGSLGREIEAWILDLLWMLVVGCWRFARL